MPIFELKSIAQNRVLENAKEDYRNSKRAEQFRAGAGAIYFPAFPGTQYLPYAALTAVRSKNTAISVAGTCGKQIPMTCVRLSYDGEFYKDFLFEKRSRADAVVERIRNRRPELEMDIAAPTSMLDR